MGTRSVATGEGSPAGLDLESHRSELIGYCYRMLGSSFEAEDAVQETMIRAWKSQDRFEGRSAVRSWIYRIATNVCLDMLSGRQRRARPMELGPSGGPDGPLETLPEGSWVEPIPTDVAVPERGDPAEVALLRDSIRLAFVTALQHLPPRQRAVLILREVLKWPAADVAVLLEDSVASVNSALQRARSTLSNKMDENPAELDAEHEDMLRRYVDAFQRYDMESLTSLIHEDATQSMPPFKLWLRGRADILDFWVGPGAGCRGSRLVPTSGANGLPAFGQYRPDPSGRGYEPWALQVVHISGGRVAEFSFFLDTARIFPIFGLPLSLD